MTGKGRRRGISRRTLLQYTAATGAAAATGSLPMPAIAQAKPIKIGYVSPATGPRGTRIIITGANFDAGSTVRFNGVTADNVFVAGATQIQADVPAGATTGVISVTSSGMTANSAALFHAPPRLTGFTPASAVANEQVTINGSSLEHATLVDRRSLLRHYVERFEPFAHWKRRIAQGFDPIEAARHARAIYDITNSAADTRDWFLDLGVFSGAIQEEGTKVAPVSGKAIDLGRVVADILTRG